MSHLIYKDNVVSVREPMWHGLGHIASDYLGREEMMKLAGHDFQILEKPLYFSVDEEDPDVSKVQGWKALVHSKDGHVIHISRESYSVIQNDQLWDIIDALVDQPTIQYETAGVLKEGAVLWVMARAATPIVVKGDPSRTWPFITCWTSHDQSMACRAMASYIRDVCWNTLSMSDKAAKEAGLSYTFRHTKNVKEKIEFAKAAIGLMQSNMGIYQDLVDTLADRPMTWEQIKDFTSDFIPMPPEAMITDRVRENVLTARHTVWGILNGELTEVPTVPPAHARTAYGLWSACVEYLDHYRTYRSKDTYFKRSIMDPGTIKMEIAKDILEVAS